MSATPVFIFASQIQPGMRIEHPGSMFPEFGGVWQVTQVRRDGDLVFIIGERSDGTPMSYCPAGINMAWLCHDALSLDEVPS